MSRSPAVFLDRDGTLIPDVGYPRDPNEIRLLPGIAPALTELREAGFRLVIVSNQSGIGRGLLTGDDLYRVHARLVELFTARGVQFDGAYYCPHAPDENCECRKPLPGLLRAAAGELRLDLSRSYMVGDKPSDVQAGRAAGCRCVLLRRPGIHPVGSDDSGADAIVEDFAAACRWILEGGDRPARRVGA